MSGFQVKLKINDKLYLKDPQSTALGTRIVQHSILLIDEIGFEQFTFKKLAQRITSTEASIYRYFENKHLLFVYLLNWYWEWMNFRIDFNTNNVDDPIKRLRIAINAIVDTAKRNTSIDFVDEDVLHRIVVSEGTKGYHTKSVDEENKDGFFLSYKGLCGKLASLFLEINPSFPYPRSLASMLVETANNNIYFTRHLPRLSDIEYDEKTYCSGIINMLEYLVFGALFHTEKVDEDVQSRVFNGIKLNGN